MSFAVTLRRWMAEINSLSYLCLDLLQKTMGEGSMVEATLMGSKSYVDSEGLVTPWQTGAQGNWVFGTHGWHL